MILPGGKGTVTPAEKPGGDAGACFVFGDGGRVEAFGVEEDGCGLETLGVGGEVGGWHGGEAAEEMVVVERKGLEDVEEIGEQRGVGVGLLIRRGREDSETGTHQARVFGLIKGVVFLADLADDGFGTFDQLGSEVLGDAVGYEGLIVDRRPGTDELAERFAKSDEIPPYDERLVFVAVAKSMIIVVGGVIRIKVIEKGKGSEIERKTENGGVIGVENAVGEGISLPLSDCQCVTAGNLAIKACEAVFFPSWRTLAF